MAPTVQRRRRRGGKHHGQHAYNRPANHDDRYGPPPGPPPAYPPLDIYSPGPGGEAYAPGYSNDYAPPSEPWRPEPLYYPRPPSPDIYGYQSGPTPTGWAPQSWEEPPPPQWANRTDTDLRLDGEPWLYERRDATPVAPPMFEPSEAWKQSHVGPVATPRTNVTPEPYSPSRRFAPRLTGDHYSSTRPLANDQYPVSIPAPSFIGDYYPQGSNPAGPPPPNTQYGPGANSGVPPPSGDYHPPSMGSTGPPFIGLHYPTGPVMNAPPFSSDHYSPLPELPGPPPPFSGDHYSPGRSLNGPQYTGNRYGRETPPIYPYMNPGSDSYRPRYEDSDTRAPHPPNPRVPPRWRITSPERGQHSPGVVSPESPNDSARTWEMNRRASLQGPKVLNHWSPSPHEREPTRTPSRGRSVTRSRSGARNRSPLYSPRASPISFHGRPPRSPSPSRSPVYSPRASLSPVPGRDYSPIRRVARSPVVERSRSPLRGRSRSPDSVRGRTPSPIRGRARSPLSPRSYVARLGRSRSRPPETYRPPKSRTRSPSVPQYRRRRSYSRSRSRSSSADSYRRRRSSGRRRRRSRSRRSVSGTRSKARSRSRDKSRSRASTLYSPTTTRLYSPVLSRKRVSRAGGKTRRGKRRGKRSNAAPKSARSSSPPEDDLYAKPKVKRSSSVGSTGSIYGPEIPPELRTNQPAQRTRDSSLSSYRSDNDKAKQQVTLIPGLSEVEQGLPAPPSKATQAQDTPPSVAQENRAEDTEAVQPPGLTNGTSLNDELRAAVAKLVSEHSTPRKDVVLSAPGDATAPSPKNGAPKLSVQIPVPDRVASPEKEAEEEHEADESDMDLSMPASPADDVPQPTETVPVVAVESVETALAAVPPSTEHAPAAPIPTSGTAAAEPLAQSVTTPGPADHALVPVTQSSHSAPLAVPQKEDSLVEESHGSTGTGTPPIVDESVPGEESDMDIDVDMDMSVPPSPILKVISPSTVVAEESVVFQDASSEADVVTTAGPVDNAAPSAPTASSDSNALSPALAAGDITSVPGVASSDGSAIPGLSLASQEHPTFAFRETRGQGGGGELRSTLQDKLAAPSTNDATSSDEELPPLSPQEVEESTVGHTPSSPAMELPAEEAECDMDMSPPPSPSPSPVPHLPVLSLEPAVSTETRPVAFLPQPAQQPITDVQPASSTVTAEAPQEPSPQTSEGAATPTPTSPTATRPSVANSPPVVVGSGTLSADSDPKDAPDVTEALSTPVPRTGAASEGSSREGSPMMVESLLGLTEPPPITESSVVPDDTVMAEGSPTVVDSMPISPIVHSESHSEQQQEEPGKEPPRKLVHLETERSIQTIPAAKDTQLTQAATDGITSALQKIADGEAHLDRPVSPAQTEVAAEDADPLTEGLRTVVMKRLQLDRQTREERVAPVLLGNLAVAEPHARQKPSADRLCHEVLHGKRKREREESFLRVRPCLQSLFAQRQASLTEKVQRLKDEYLSLHDRWMVHCAKLDEVAKAAALEEAAANAGRTTRRSAAMGDAVRTDLEMEQIIASLGNEELTDANHLAARNAATIPDMISVTKGSVDYLYNDTNNVVEDPANFYTPNTCLEDWTDEEKDIFLEKYALYPKQFGIIADFLPNKTAAECVTYYYLHKKTLIDFRKVLARNATGKRKRGGGRGGKKKGNALLEDIRKHDAEVSRDSTPSGPTTRRRRGAQPATNENGEPLPRRASTRKSAVQVENSPGTTPAATPDPDPEPRRRRRAPRPTARAVVIAEPEVEEDATETEPKPAKRARRSRKVKSAETVESPVMSEAPLLFNETRFIDQTELTARKRTPTGSVQWTDEDKELFVGLLAQHGNDFKRISASMPNKTAVQLSVYYKANAAELNLDKVTAKGRKGTPSPDPQSASEGYKEMSLPGSITPTTRASTPSVMAASSSSNNFEAQYKLDDPTSIYKSKLRASASNGTDLERPSSRPGSSLAVPSSSSSSLASLQFRSSSLETMRAQYGGPDLSASPFTMQSRLSPFASVIPPPLTMNGSPFVESARGAGSGGPLTMTFPSSFAYSNLSPSHFAGEQRPPPRGYGGGGASSGSAPAGATMMFEASVFAPPPDGTAGFTFGRSDGPPVPATLQTTEDLVAYLEHRTRLAEQRESDFM